MLDIFGQDDRSIPVVSQAGCSLEIRYAMTEGLVPALLRTK